MNYKVTVLEKLDDLINKMSTLKLQVNRSEQENALETVEQVEEILQDIQFLIDKETQR